MHRKTSTAWLAVLALFLAIIDSRAEWPTEITLSGRALTYPVIADDGHGGAFTAGAAINSGNSWDVFVFHHDSSGNSLWNEVGCQVPYAQYPLALAKDGNGGVIALIDDWPGFPQVKNRLWLVYFLNGDSVWSSLVCDSMIGIRDQVSLNVHEDQAIVVWHDSRTDSPGLWFARFDLANGTCLDEDPRFLTNAIYHAATIDSTSMPIAASDKVWLLNLESGIIDTLCEGLTVSVVSIISLDNRIIVAGKQGGNIILEVFEEGVLSATYVLSEGISFYTEVRLVVYEQTIFVSYLRDYDLFGRYFDPVLGPEEEITICDAQNNQYGHQLVAGVNGIAVTWYDAREAHQIFIQQIDGQPRWLNGFCLGSMASPSPRPQIAACSGSSDYGLVLWGDNSHFFLQPVDSLVIDDVANEPSLLPAQFRLFNPYPNPCNGPIQIEFELAKPTQILLTVYNSLGQQVAVIAQGWKAAGNYRWQWDGATATGKYWLTLITSQGSQTKSFAVIK